FAERLKTTNRPPPTRSRHPLPSRLGSVSFPPIVEPLSPKATLALDPVAEMTLLDAPIRSYSVIAFRLTLIRHPRESVVSGQRRSGHAGSPLARECQSEAIVTVEGRNKAVTQLQGRALISMPPIFEALLTGSQDILAL